MTTPDKGIDESFTYADPAAAKADGVDCVMMYLSHTPSKNATPAKILGYHKVGIGVLLGWEAGAGGALAGAGGGAADGADAAAQYDALIKAMGYAPRNKPAIAFAVDFDTNPAQYPPIDAYLTAAKHALAGRYLCGVYGEADLLDHTASHGISEMEFGTYAWSGGRISVYDDFHQYLNGQRLYGAEVDLDKILHPAQVCAWWPPGSPYNSPNPTEDDGMADITQARFTELFVNSLRDPKVVDALADATGPRTREIVGEVFEHHHLQTSETNLANEVVRRVESVVAGKGDPGHDPKAKP